MSRIQEKFKQLRKNNETALVSYIMAGYPSEKTTLMAVRGLIKGGADIIELGFPFSDPIADGPTIQMASCLLYTSPSPRDRQKSRMPSSA